MTKYLCSTAIALALVGCGQQESYESEEGVAYEDASMAQTEGAMGRTAPAVNQPPVTEASADMAGGPDVAPTAAPGVAFAYSYAFRLANNQIAGVQEQHAAACEELGIARCRIIGMRYRLVNEEDVEAMLAFKLDPAIARQFGREAGQLVTDNEGMLVDAEITGVDAGAAIAQGERQRAQLTDDIAELERRLARQNLSEGERVQLTQQLERLRQAQRGTQASIEANEESLATTPMVFRYGSGRIVPGFDPQEPISDAFARGGELFWGGIGFLIVLIAALLPWAVVLALIILGIRALGPIRDRWSKRGAEDEA